MTNSWKRPKLKIPKTMTESILDIIGYSSYLGSTLFLLIIWSRLPEKVPVHYNVLGKVDRWGSKWELFILSGVGAFMILLMQTLEKYPEAHNYPQRVNESNAEQFYTNSRKLVNQLKNFCLILLAFTLFESIFIALGLANGFGKWLLPLTIIGIGGSMLLAIIRQRKIK